MVNLATDEKIIIEDQEIERVGYIYQLRQTLRFKDCSKDKSCMDGAASEDTKTKDILGLCNKSISMSLRISSMSPNVESRGNSMTR